MNNILRTVFFCFITVVFFSCVSVHKDPTKFESAPFLGIIYNGQNEGVSSAEIIIDGNIVAETDINGRFIIPDFERGQYTIEIIKEEYERKLLSFEFLNRNSILYVTMKSAQDYMEDLDRYLAQGNFAKAHEAMLNGQAISPHNPALNFISSLYYSHTGDYQAAFTILSELIREHPYEPSLYLALLDVAYLDLSFKPQLRKIFDLNPVILHNQRILGRWEEIIGTEAE